MKHIKKILEKNNVKSYGFTNFSLKDIAFITRKNDMLESDLKSVIVMSFPYYSKKITNGNISIYARVEDYHKVVKKILDPVVKNLNKSFYGHRFLIFIDSSPISEVDFAIKAGLGVKGKNNLLITKDYGSYVFLASIITTLKLKESKPNYDPCISCDLCIKKCPGDAIKNNKVVKEKCLSHITQKKGVLSEEEENLIKVNKTLWGCDICQEVCPHNKIVEDSYIKGFLDNIINNLDYDNVDETYKKRAYGFRGKNVLIRNLDILNKK
ncbi:MAG: epoxyqueuosine reductase [Oscillospiraceae bacterium]